MSSTLILLVGSNPLPNYLSACTLQPNQIILIYSAETIEAMQRLKLALSNVCENWVSREIRVDDATCSTDVKRAVDDALKCVANGDAWLNYTGGTKVMAAHARMAFKEMNGLNANASYLDEGGPTQAPRLRFDDGTSKALAGCGSVPLTLETILGLHGICYTHRTPKDPAPTTLDAKAILDAVLANVSLASQLYDERKRLAELKTPTKAEPEPFVPKEHGLTLSLSQLPINAQMNRKAFEQWYSFIGGEWLEVWLGQAINDLGLTPCLDIVVGVNAQRGDKKANLEVDIAVVRGHRSYFISCTTDTTKHICKSKLFEVAVRSRQLGGDLARAALVCLANDNDVCALQQDINEVWGATNTTKVFGLSDLMTWSGHHGSSANTNDLREWLES